MLWSPPAVKKSVHNRGAGGRSPKADLTLAEDIALALKNGRPGGAKVIVRPSRDAISFIQGEFCYVWSGLVQLILA